MVKSKKKDISLIGEESNDKSEIEISTGKKSVLQSVIDQLRSGKSVTEVREAQ